MRGGATTVVDASFTGASVAAMSELGLRGVIALEVFGGSDDDAVAIADRLDARLDPRPRMAGLLVELGVSPHAPYTVAPALYEEVVRARATAGRRVVTHIAESQHELDALVRGEGLLAERSRRAWVAPYGRHPIAELVERGLLGPRDRRRARGARRSRRDRAARRERSLGRPLPALERAARMRNRPARGAPAGGCAGRSRNRRAVVGARSGRLRRAARSGHVAARVGGRPGCAGSTRTRCVSRPSAAPRRSASSTRSGASRRASEQTSSPSVWVTRPSGPAKILLRDLVLAGSGERVIFTMVNGIVRYRVSDDSYRAALARGRDVRRRMLALST